MAGTRAPSCHLYFDDKQNGNIILQDVLVPSDGLAKFTYYCCMQWNAGQEGGGYCGIQDHPDGNCFIFSIWDPIASTSAIKAVHVGPGTKVENFGGEGTGLKSMNFGIGWKPDQWYTLVVRRWCVQGHSHFGFWTHDQTEDVWHHLVTMDFPVSKVFFKKSTVSFIEDWHGNGDQMRRVHFKNGFKRVLKSWITFKNVHFNVLQEDACKLYNDNYDGGVYNDCFFLQTGCGTTPKPVLKTNRKFVCSESAEAKPCKRPIIFDITKVSTSYVTWAVPQSSTPQFSYAVLNGSTVVASGVGSEVRRCNIRAAVGDWVTVTLTDILDEEFSRLIKVI